MEPIPKMCSYIEGDANLYSLFRVDSNPVPCPFRGPLRFSYDRGRGECGSPASEMESCTEETRLVFNYQACPNVPGSEMMSKFSEFDPNLWVVSSLRICCSGI